jgi:hypothetical protein
MDFRIIMNPETNGTPAPSATLAPSSAIPATAPTILPPKPAPGTTTTTTKSASAPPPAPPVKKAIKKKKKKNPNRPSKERRKANAKAVNLADYFTTVLTKINRKARKHTRQQLKAATLAAEKAFVNALLAIREKHHTKFVEDLHKLRAECEIEYRREIVQTFKNVEDEQLIRVRHTLNLPEIILGADDDSSDDVEESEEEEEQVEIEVVSKPTTPAGRSPVIVLETQTASSPQQQQQPQSPAAPHTLAPPSPKTAPKTTRVKRPAARGKNALRKNKPQPMEA